MKYLILGNGPAGVIAAEALRKADPKGKITMVGSEDEPPYSRMAIPYLLEGNIDEAGTYLRKAKTHFKKLKITNKVAKATAIDSDAKTVALDDGSSEKYDKLLIATGSHPIRPPISGIDLPHVHTCWTLKDARAIAQLAKQGKKVVQVGAGFIGCIILEAFAKNGVDLTVVELGDRMVPRMMTQKAGGIIKDWVQDKGVRVVTSAKVEAIAAPGQTSGSLLESLKNLFGGASSSPISDDQMTVTLSTGEKIGCDLVVMSAGVRPNIDFLTGSGVEVANGILTDRNMQSSVADIYAAGDVAEAPDLYSKSPMVSAIQPNAADQARIAALNMAGKSAEHAGVLAINVLDTLGLISSSFGQWEGVDGGDGVELSEPKYNRYISLQFKDDVLVGATSVGLTQHVGVLRGLIQGEVSLGEWKDILMDEPLRVMDAYLACAQQPMVLNG
jgi:NAD(P)H-nitrite reductase large subunit